MTERARTGQGPTFKGPATSPSLIVMAGLPCAGKSVIAEGLADRLDAALVSIDPIEAAMWRAGLPKGATGVAAYGVAAALAEENLRIGRPVVIDAVNPVEAPRAMWRALAERRAVRLRIVECVCSDVQRHRRRVEARVRNIEAMPEITWAAVERRRVEYEPWSDSRLVLDTARGTVDTSIAEALAYIAEIGASLG